MTFPPIASWRTPGRLTLSTKGQTRNRSSQTESEEINPKGITRNVDQNDPGRPTMKAKETI